MEQLVNISVVVCPIALYVWSNYSKKCAEKKKKQNQLLERLVEHRDFPRLVEFQKALNSIPLIFSESKEVLDALKEFEFAMDQHIGFEREKLGNLFKIMYTYLGLEANFDVIYLTKNSKF
ncbi:DUF6680 family protein [Candidatus Enterococcus ikei]|uniref:DUF6680 domain-containing protein n=1 Tax=Candidatus Enterococcus ikei TaxID=2815326 RepID=A0ABS3GXB8_9ENTE|nr:DUF6680 family protein [Enterococcus sp. DIV0869a]MBO0439619.1 hypothetical protein [Enterococcus sp. DIV0869a]